MFDINTKMLCIHYNYVLFKSSKDEYWSFISLLNQEYKLKPLERRILPLICNLTFTIILCNSFSCHCVSFYHNKFLTFSSTSKQNPV